MVEDSVEKWRKSIVEVSCTLDENYKIIMGDESFYQVAGLNEMYPFDRLIDPDQRLDFEKFMKEESSKVFITRCRLSDDAYRWTLIWKISGTSTLQDRKLTKLKLQDVIGLSITFEQYFKRVKKYRAVINMLKEKLFEYDIQTGMFTIYCYMNNRSEIIEKDNFMEWKKRVCRMGFVEDGQKERFNRLCDSIQEGMESFSISLRTSFMSKGEREDLLGFQGQTVMDGGEKYLTIGMISELENRYPKHNELYDISEIDKDSATGVLNKKAVTDRIIIDIDRTNVVESNKIMYLVVIDIDDFKRVNDTYGHFFGDEVIFQFANELAHAVGKRGIVGRIGGDEFILLIKEVNDIEEVKGLLTSVRKKLRVKLAEQKNDYEFSISAGISEYAKDGKNYESLFKIADGALYIAKAKGKDRYIIYDKEKHGDLLNDELRKQKYASGIDFMKPLDKYQMASELMIKIMRNGKKVISEVLSELMDKMNLHGISVYTGSKMKCDYATGHYEHSPEEASYLFENDYLRLFDEHRINRINNTMSIAVDFPAVYQTMKENNICSALQMLVYADEKPAAMIEFDTFGTNRRKWSQDDISTVFLIAKAIEDAYKNEKNN